MENTIVAAIQQASGLSADEVENLVVRSKDLKHGDYAFPCFILAKLWKKSLKHTNLIT